jgi:hypothetical protein
VDDDPYARMVEEHVREDKGPLRAGIGLALIALSAVLASLGLTTLLHWVAG